MSHGRAWALVAALALLARGAAAHPLLFDRVDARLEPDRAVVEVHTTLRTPMVALHREREAYSADELSSAVREAAPYFAAHLALTVSGVRAQPVVLDATVDEPCEAGVLGEDLERSHATFRLAYALPASNDTSTTATFATTVLEEFEVAPGQPWQETLAVVVKTDESHTASGVLRAGAPLTLTVTRPPTPQPTRGRWLVFAVVLLAGAAALVRFRPRRPWTGP